MNYIVFDLEFNQNYDFINECKGEPESGCPFEIIQIGAIKLNKNLETIDTFKSFVRPTLYSRLHPYVRDLTNINESDLYAARPFNEVFVELEKFLTKDKSILCVWGVIDIKELFRNIEYHNLDSTNIPMKYINLQSYASKYLNVPSGTNIGLSNAVESLSISITSEFHDAFNDAYYTAEVFKKIYSKKIRSSKYIPKTSNSSKTETKVKYKLDEDALFNQFEKMYDRQITAEEKIMIKTAYMMGKTNQFQIEMPVKARKKYK